MLYGVWIIMKIIGYAFGIVSVSVVAGYGVNYLYNLFSAKDGEKTNSTNKTVSGNTDNNHHQLTPVEMETKQVIEDYLYMPNRGAKEDAAIDERLFGEIRRCLDRDKKDLANLWKNKKRLDDDREKLIKDMKYVKSLYDVHSEKLDAHSEKLDKAIELSSEIIKQQYDFAVELNLDLDALYGPKTDKHRQRIERICCKGGFWKDKTKREIQPDFNESQTNDHGINV